MCSLCCIQYQVLHHNVPCMSLPRLEEGEAGSDINGHGQGEDKSRFEELHHLVGLWSGGGVGLKLGGSR